MEDEHFREIITGFNFLVNKEGVINAINLGTEEEIGIPVGFHADDVGIVEVPGEFVIKYLSIIRVIIHSCFQG
jgi:hypothetical protein